MNLRSRFTPTNPESNLVKVKVNKYEYSIDLLTLNVYDEYNTKYTIGSILSTTLEDNARLTKTIDELNQFIDDEKDTTKRLVETLDACIEYTKSLNAQILVLQNEIQNIKDKGDR